MRPSDNNPLPFYFHTGLVYKGLIPQRDQDQIGVAFAYGNYSYYKQIADESRGRTAQIYEAVLEFDYRVQVNKWFYAQPVIQVHYPSQWNWACGERNRPGLSIRRDILTR